MTDIVKRTLGRTGYEVTALAYGAMELRGAPPGRHIDPQEAGRILNAVLDGGINMIDTSIDYGVSEELIGRHISTAGTSTFWHPSAAAGPLRAIRPRTLCEPADAPPTSSPARISSTAWSRAYAA